VDRAGVLVVTVVLVHDPPALRVPVDGDVGVPAEQAHDLAFL